MTATIFCRASIAMGVSATYLGFDDTDSPHGMCTTFLATLILDELRCFDLIGLPRLVRLNPNVPWKTRGNAAVCLPLGRGVGAGRVCGAIDGRPVMSYARGSSADQEEILPLAARVLERVAEFDCDKTNPGMVATNKKPSQRIYWRAVREVVQLSDVERELKVVGASWKRYKNGRGIIGATSAISCRPHDRTWEVISYRTPDRIGTERAVDRESVIRMDRKMKSTFHNYDSESKHIAITPASPCPVLFGIRGDSADELMQARKMIRGEPPLSWLLFLTNQGTDDHIVRCRVRDFEPGMSVRVQATVAAPPRSVEGGHVIVNVSDGDAVDVAFYEPSGVMNRAARHLIPGDGIEVYGSVRDSPRSLNAEKLHVLHLAVAHRKDANPLCVVCEKRMGSLGAGQGYRCKRCGARAPAGAAEIAEVSREIRTGWYEPPVASRRHLHRPIRRMSRDDINNLL
ncbi:MAG: tRNA(Ile)(2)-agmatinylcytidine synthase [Candidatus Thermoplasmatota archaeon]|nr:tRNA(Ile)(2)-agmatinylcytidine synthase [Candidatus Thermoplasmatota archaeon]